MLHYSPTSQFWMCNRVANACYKMYDRMAAFVRERTDAFENEQMFTKVPQTDQLLLAVYNGRNARKAGNKRALKKVINGLTNYTVGTAMDQFAAWTGLEETLLVKFIDGNIKAQDESGAFVHSQYHEGTPEGLVYGGYNELWKRTVAKEHGNVIEVK